MPELERETELKNMISKTDLITEEYKRFPSKNIIDIIEPLEKLLNFYIEKFEASKTAMAIDLLIQEASNYDTKETNKVISYQKYQILLGTLISKLKTLIPLLKERLEEFKICSYCGHEHLEPVDKCESCGLIKQVEILIDEELIKY